MRQPIIVGFDGSDHGRDALVVARMLADALDTPLIAVNAYTPEQLLWAPGTAEPLDEQQRLERSAAAEAVLG